MMLDKVKAGLVMLDDRIFNGKIKSFHSRYVKYRGKAYVLTQDLYFPPHTASNKNVKMGPAGELLAIGGDLEPDRLIHAKKRGIYIEVLNDHPILWWTSEIRCVIFPENIHISKIMRRVIRQKNGFHLTVDKAFHDVVIGCTELRGDYVWLTSEYMSSYFRLHKLGVAHSVEVWREENLVGGLFGVAFGSYFYVESKFTRVNHTSKLAIIALSLRLRELNYSLVDCGIWPTDHLKSLGATIISRDSFLEILDQSVQIPDRVEDWEELFENWDFKQAAENRITEERQDAGTR